MYNTYMLERVGCFHIHDSCKSIDVTKDSKYLIAGATTQGVKIFDTSNGDQKAELKIQGSVIKLKQVELSYSDKQLIVVYTDRQESFLKIYDMKDVLANGMGKEGVFLKPTHTIPAPKDHEINCAKWGALDKVIYYCTDRGRILKKDLELDEVTGMNIHKNEIFSLNITPDFTMLYTTSRDGTCKLLHPQTFDEIRCHQFDGFPCRDCAVSPLYESAEQQKFHVLLCGGQDAKDVTTTGQ